MTGMEEFGDSQYCVAAAQAGELEETIKRLRAMSF